MQTLHDCIRRAVIERRLREPFKANDVKRVCRHRWKTKTYSSSLSKHEQKKSGNYRKYYKRVSRGKYKLIEKIRS
jgi:hypothetical protein